MANAKARGDELLPGLRASRLGSVRDPRRARHRPHDRGGFDSHERAAAVEWGSFQRGLLVLEAGHTVVRISPPLVITAEEAAVG